MCEAIVYGIALSLALGNQTVISNSCPFKSRSIGVFLKSRTNLPRGPSTVTILPSNETVTPSGIYTLTIYLRCIF